MGFKIKKVFKKATKFAATVTGVKLADKVVRGQLLGGDAQKAQKDQEAAAQREAEIARQQAAQQQQQLQLMQANFQADLSGENLAQVTAGGSADLASASSDPLKRKKASGLSSTLGFG